MSEEVLKLKQQGNDAFSSGDYSQAAILFTRAIELDPNNHVLFSNRSGAYASMKQYDDALLDANKCIEINPKFIKGYSRKGTALHGLDRLDEAADAYEEGLRVDPNNEACKQGLEEVNKLTGNSGIPPPRGPGMGGGPGLGGPGLGGPGGDGLRNMFANAKTVIHNNPKLKQYENDAAFMKVVDELQTDPQAFTRHIGDPRVMTLVTACLGLPDDFQTRVQNRDDPYGANPNSPHSSSSSYTPYSSSSSSSAPKYTAPKNDLDTPKGKAAKLKEEGNEFYKKKQLGEALQKYNEAIAYDPTQSAYYLNKAAVLLELGNKADGEIVKKTQEQLDKEKAEKEEKKKVQEGAVATKAEDGAESAGAAEGMKKEGETEGDAPEDDDDDDEPVIESADGTPVEKPKKGKSKTFSPSSLPTIVIAPLFVPDAASADSPKQQYYEHCVDICLEAVSVAEKNNGGYEQVAKAYLRLSNAYTKLLRYDAALSALDRSLTEHRTDEAVKKKRELQALKKKQEEEEYLSVEKGEEARLKGNELFQKGDFSGAVEFYTDSIKRNPKDARVFSNRAACYAKVMNWSAALDDCDKAIELDAKFIKAYIRKGSIQTFLKQYTLAMKTYKTAMELEPNNAEVYKGYQELMQRISQSQSSDGPDEQQVHEAMKDPEIQSILNDPIISNVLRDMQTNPAAAREHMQNPRVAQALTKLIAAGIIKTK